MALAAAAAAVMLAGCGGGSTEAPEPGTVGNDAEQAYQAALDKQQQEERDAIQAEIDAWEANTKPYGETEDIANHGSGEGLAGLGDDGSGAAAEEGVTETGAGATAELPDGMPDLTMAALGVPEWSGQPWVLINGGTPYFSMPEGRPRESETYAALDQYRRPGAALAVVLERCDDMADYVHTVQAGTLSVPGWNDYAFPGIIAGLDAEKLSDGEAEDGKLFYLRRLVGSGLGRLEPGRRNSMVCTEYMGEYGLRSLEEAVLRYMERTHRRVVYRVTPVFEGKEQVARGAVVEAMSYGDSQSDIGAGLDLCFNMFVYNVQPGITIDYMTGEADVDDSADPNLSSTLCGAYVLDTSRKQAHMGMCDYLISDVHPAVQSFYYGSIPSLRAWSIDWNSCPCMDGVLDMDGPEPDGGIPTEPEEPDEQDDEGRSGTVNVGLGEDQDDEA